MSADSSEIFPNTTTFAFAFAVAAAGVFIFTILEQVSAVLVPVLGMRSGIGIDDSGVIEDKIIPQRGWVAQNFHHGWVGQNGSRLQRQFPGYHGIPPVIVLGQYVVVSSPGGGAAAADPSRENVRYVTAEPLLEDGLDDIRRKNVAQYHPPAFGQDSARFVRRQRQRVHATASAAGTIIIIGSCCSCEIEFHLVSEAFLVAANFHNILQVTIIIIEVAVVAVVVAVAATFLFLLRRRRRNCCCC